MKTHLLTILLCLLALNISAQTADSLEIKDITSKVTYGHRVAQRPARSVDVIVVHSSYYAGADSFSTAGVIRQYEQYRVAPHYLIERDGSIIRMVAEKDVAYHAGKSTLPGHPEHPGLNSSSIGIEIINTKAQGPTEEQYQTLARLIDEICQRHPIRYIVGHATIAPGRKTDPWAFDWQHLMELLPSKQNIILPE